MEYGSSRPLLSKSKVHIYASISTISNIVYKDKKSDDLDIYMTKTNKSAFFLFDYTIYSIINFKLIKIIFGNYIRFNRM